ncbi:hypothetical protein DFJ77DRAFT_509402 [Powellomyces hirtus]|nr:hypothetical protein DFJ77DRAFT_509402 [Powellomyces hirtus]
MSSLPSNLQPIQVTPSEDRLFTLLSTCAKQIQAENPEHPPVVLRVAGGWVRDKLLGKANDDIDIAIDTMKGEPFAQRVNQCMKEQGLEMGHIATIQTNPEKSKHLETANARVFEYLVDFVHLRTETYNDDSRNPDVDFGTPFEDASRRDITINALFYNISTRQVEDFLEKGLDDLSQGHVRTPLPALQTFIDDPLRVLRVIRFATRFGYTIDEDILETVKNEDVKRAFERKITRERVGVEFNKMIKGPDPVRALQLINDFGFYPLVFAPPVGVEQVHIIPGLVVAYARFIEIILASQELEDMFADSTKIAIDDEDRRLLFLTASVVPFAHHTWEDKKMRTHYLSKEIILTSLKLGLHDADAASTVLESLPRVLAAVREHPDRRTLALLIRELGKPPLHAKWYLAVLFAWADEALKEWMIHLPVGASHPHDLPALPLPSDAFTHDPYARLAADPIAHDEMTRLSAARAVQRASQQFISFMRSIREMGIEDAQDFRAYLNGKEVAAILGIRPGIEIGTYLKALTEWQLGKPQANKEECVAWLESYAEEHPPQSNNVPMTKATKKRKSG